MISYQQASAIYALQIQVVEKDKTLKPYFEHSSTGFRASIRSSKGYLLMNVYVIDGEDDEQMHVDYYHKKLSLLAINKEFA